MNKIWTLAIPNGEDSRRISEQLELSPIVAEILTQRGLISTDQALDFLRPSLLNITSPFCFRDMDKAVGRLADARNRQEKVLVYGDYDVDGVTSTALLYKVLIDLGFHAVAYIPHRQEEGYGLNAESVEKAAQAEVKIILTVDCGITAQTEVELANRCGIDVIITDHHEPPAVLPAALAILNPKLKTSGYPFRELAGVGVAFKLVQALLQKLGNSEVGIQSELEILDLVALGTIADVVPLTGENRIFVHHGLRQMEKTIHPGLAALRDECGLRGKALTAGQIAFMLAPRINAAGRMDSARTGLELLLTQDPERAAELVRQLSKENTLRQETERRILADTIARLEAGPLPRVIVLSSADWHHGVIGIVASRLVERYYRPVFLISEDGTESKGSARGISGYHVLEQLNTQAVLLTKFGGHRQAAGFSLPTEQIEELRQGLNLMAERLAEDTFSEFLKVDNLVQLAAITSDLQRDLELLAPFGFGNPGPTLAARAVPVASVVALGKEAAHLKLRLGVNGELEGMAFRQGERVEELASCSEVDIAFSLEKNTFQGQEKLVLVLKDVQEEAKWRKDACSVAGEDAALGQESRIKWLDWRAWERQRWIKQALAECCLFPPHVELELSDRIAIWDATGWETRYLTLSEFRGNGQSDLKQSIVPRIDQIGLESKGDWVLGIMVGIPQSWREFQQGVRQLKALGVSKIAFAEVNGAEQMLQQRSGFLGREELIAIYRGLQDLAQQNNPFIWTPPADPRFRYALRVFEELGLIRCLGGTELLAVELLPVGQKMELDSSLAYRVSKKRWQEMQELCKYMLEAQVEMLATDKKS